MKNKNFIFAFLWFKKDFNQEAPVSKKESLLSWVTIYMKHNIVYTRAHNKHMRDHQHIIPILLQ